MARGSESIAADPANQFFPISVAELTVGTVPSFDLYVARGPTFPKFLLQSAGTPFTAEVRDRLRNNNAKAVYIREDQRVEYYRCMENQLALVLMDDSISTQEKSRILYGAAFNAVRDFFQDPSSENLLSRATSLAENVVSFLTTKQDAFGHVLGRLSRDYAVYTHSVNVSIYSLSLASYLGFDNQEELVRLGTGTLLHDLGKSRVSPEILHKEGKLDKDEWDQIKKHPEWGVELLEERGVTDDMVIEITWNHHEKLNGKGYPRRLKADQLTPYVRLTTICDIFDALTTKRSYKDAINSFDALALMKNEMHEELDSEYFRLMVLMMSAHNHWRRMKAK